MLSSDINQEDNKYKYSYSKTKLRSIPKRDFLFFYKLKKLLIWLKTSTGKIIYHQATLDIKTLEKNIKELRISMINDAEKRGFIVNRNTTSIRSFSDPDTSETDKKNNFKELAKKLYQQLIAPFEKYLNIESTLAIVPHDFLWLLPFSALVDSFDKYFLKQYKILYTPSIKTLEQIDNDIPYSDISDANALVLGNPTMSTAHPNYPIFNSLLGAEK